MANMQKIYSAWNGNAETMAADLGQAGVTVRQWRNRGNIPPAYWADVIAKAAEKGVALVVADFGELPPEIEAVERARDAERDAA